MAVRKRKKEVEKFKNVYDGLVVPELRNFDINLDVEFHKMIWIETGEVDHRVNRFDLTFNIKDKGFVKLMNKDISGVLGWKGLFFSPEHNNYLIKKDYGSVEEQKELLSKVFEAFKVLDDKIDYIREDSPQSFEEDALKFNKKIENPYFILEYDLENNRCYFISKAYGFSDFNLFFRANVSPKMSGIPEIEDDLEHKVKNIPGYKEKTYLKEHVRKKCFLIPSTNYSMIADSVRNCVKIEEVREKEANNWLDKPENLERVKAVLIEEPNDFKFNIKFDEKKKVVLLSYKKFEANIFVQKSKYSSDDLSNISNTRIDALSMLLYNEVLLRPEKESDINRKDNVQSTVANLDDRDMWMTPSEKPSSLLGDVNVGFLSKVCLERRVDSKNGIFYLEVEKNIEELETIKANFDKLNETYVKKFQELVILDVRNPIVHYNQKYPGLFLDKNDGKAYLVFDGERVLAEDGKSHNYVIKTAIEISEEKVEEIFLNEDKQQVFNVIKENFQAFYLNLKVGNNVMDEVGRAYLEELKLSWKTSRVMNKFGFSLSQELENPQNDEGSGMSFKL